MIKTKKGLLNATLSSPLYLSSLVIDSYHSEDSRLPLAKITQQQPRK